MDEFREWWTSLFAAADAAGLPVADMDEDFADAGRDLPDGLEASAVVALAVELGADSLLADLRKADLAATIPESAARSGGCVGFRAGDGTPHAGCTVVHAGRFLS